MKQRQKISKAERYNWLPLDREGEFQWIDKRRLVVPTEEYQRDGNNLKELRIASNFSWAAFQVLSVASRGDGRFNVIEGGHRLRAALKRDDVNLVPCLVFAQSSQKDQAETFVKINSDRKPMGAVDKHKAYLVAGDPVALTIQDYVDSAGRYVSKSASATTVACILDIRRCIERDAEAFERIWPIVVELCEGNTIHQAIVSGLFFIEMRASEAASTPRVRRRILQFGYDEILMAGKKGREFHGSGTPKHFASGILQLINKGLHKKVTIE